MQFIKCFTIIFLLKKLCKAAEKVFVNGIQSYAFRSNHQKFHQLSYFTVCTLGGTFVDKDFYYDVEDQN